jgi:integrase
MEHASERAGRSKRIVKANDLAVQKIARSKLAKQGEWAVEGERGLSIVVKAAREGVPGVATYYVRYQIGKGDKRKQVRHALGRAGEGGMSLAAAREKARNFMSEVATGEDPVANQAARDASLTLKQLFDERAEKDTDTAPRTLDDYRMALEKDVFDELGERPATEIKPEEFAMVLERVDARAKHSAHKVRSALGSTYRWGQTQWRNGARLVVVNPVAGIGFMHQSKPRKRVLSDTELAKLWKSIDSPSIDFNESTRIIVKLAILTGQRNSEVAGAELSELKGLNSATPRWDIPARRMKRKSDDQFVPLVPQAVQLFMRATEIAKGSQYVFPGVTQGRRRGREWRQEHIGQETISRAFARIAKLAGLKDARLHDMRKCVTSWLADHGHASAEVLDAILHHGRKGVTGTHYNFALYEGQVRKALQAWADHVEHVAGGSSGKSDAAAKVTRLHSRNA